MDKHQDENDENNENSSETVNQKRILHAEITGKVKWFNVKLGYGFVCRNDNQEDVFIHQSAIVKSNPEHPRKSVEDGEEILFDIVQGIKGNEAANVCGVDGNCVKGSEYALRFPRGRGRGRGSFRGRMRMESAESGVRTQDYYRGGNRGRPFRGNRQNVTQNRPVKKEDHETSEVPNEKPLICTGITGKVKWFNVKRAYGFVCRNDNQEDIFIHQSAIAKSNPDHPRKSVEDGEEILFDIVQGAKGYEAANVSAVDGKCVKGSEYALRFPRSGRGRGRGRGRGGSHPSFRGGRGKSRDVSEDDELGPPHEFYRGQPPPMGPQQRGRPFYPRRSFPRPYRGGRPFGVPPFIESYNYEVPPDYFYEIEPGYYDQMRAVPRGRFNGPRFRGGPPRDAMPMKVGVFDSAEFYDRRGPPNMRAGGGGGRPRGRGRMPMRAGGRVGGRGRSRGGDQWTHNRGDGVSSSGGGGGAGGNSGQTTTGDTEQRQQQQRDNNASTNANNNHNDNNND